MYCGVWTGFSLNRPASPGCINVCLLMNGPATRGCSKDIIIPAHKSDDKDNAHVRMVYARTISKAHFKDLT
jgi:hypothetical protein